jgi:1-deoxy-D-xylulose-5-phosphate reductoisomerase
MKKKIVVLGSTGSIGLNTLKVIRNNKKDFSLKLLSTNTKVEKALKQAKEFGVKHLIINDQSKFNLIKKKKLKFDIKIYNSFKILNKLFSKNEIDYTMVSVSGLDGLEPSIESIKFSKNIGIVNKESLISGWSLIKKKLMKFNTNFIPVDSEHFSIYSLIKHNKLYDIKKIFITASGGPFLNYPLKSLNKVSLKEALKHPNWKMGKKISIDSATMMNKVFEVIEAKNIFNLNYKQISILIHPQSYIHAIVQFKNSINQILFHEPDMTIPIHNSIYNFKKNIYYKKKLNFTILNDLKLKPLNLNQFLLTKLLKILPNKNSLYETALITINDFFVDKFLKKKINFNQMTKLIYSTAKKKIFLRFRKKTVKDIDEIYKLRKFVRLKLDTLGI